MTMWFPDTCDCQIEISDHEATRGEVIRHVKRCSIHSSRHEDHHAVLAENQRKNYVLADIQQDFPTAAPRWSYDDDRNVVIEFEEKKTWRGRRITGDDGSDIEIAERYVVASALNPTAAQKVQLRTKFDAKYGIGKVRVP